MNRRPASSLFASILLIVQLLMAPFTHAESIPAGDAGCSGTAQQHARAAAGKVVVDCLQMSADAGGHGMPSRNDANNE